MDLDGQLELQRNFLTSQSNNLRETLGAKADFNSDRLESSEYVADLNSRTQQFIQTSKSNTQVQLQHMRSDDIAQSFTNNFISGATAGVAGFAGNLITGGLNYMYANNLLDKQASLQRQNFDYTTNKAEAAYTSAGLPSWLAFSGGAGAGAFPHQSQQISGTNFFTSSLPGNTSQLAWTGSQSQLALGVGAIPSADS